MTEGNYFSEREKNAIHDAFLMIVSPHTDYDSVEDVLVGETNYTQDDLDYWKGEAELDG